MGRWGDGGGGEGDDRGAQPPRDECPRRVPVSPARRGRITNLRQTPARTLWDTSREVGG